MVESKNPKQKSKYQLRIRNMRNGKQKKFKKNGGSRAWLKARHRMRKKMLR